jgi:hypothetical protein
MRKLRFSIASLLALILVLGVGFAALRESSDLWDSGLFTVTLGILLISILLAVHRTESRQAFWLGFAVRLRDHAMRRFRFHIGTIAILILVLGVGFAALRESNGAWNSRIFSLALGVLLISVLLAIHRTESRRAFWIGFALMFCFSRNGTNRLLE